MHRELTLKSCWLQVIFLNGILFNLLFTVLKSQTSFQLSVAWSELSSSPWLSHYNTCISINYMLPQYYNREAVCNQIILMPALVYRITRSRCWSAYTAFRNSLLGGGTDKSASVCCHSGTWEGLNCFFLSEGYLWELLQFRKRHWCETCGFVFFFFFSPSSWSPYVKELSFDLYLFCRDWTSEPISWAMLRSHLKLLAVSYYTLPELAVKMFLTHLGVENRMVRTTPQWCFVQLPGNMLVQTEYF